MDSGLSELDPGVHGAPPGGRPRWTLAGQCGAISCASNKLHSILKGMSHRLSSEHLAAWRAFLIAHSALLDTLERQHQQEGLVPLTWYDVLVTLSEAADGSLRMHELAGRVLISRSGLTRLVDRMEQAELVRRDICPTDRRGSFATVTDKGRAELKRSWPVHARLIQEYFARHISSAEAEVLTAIFSRMITAKEVEPDLAVTR